jgi:hypothetical protein
MDRDMARGMRLCAFVLFTLGCVGGGWATEQNGSGLVGALCGLSVAFVLTAVAMFVATLDLD